MAGRYDSNPFDEDEVNPFSVSKSSCCVRSVFMNVAVCGATRMSCFELIFHTPMLQDLERSLGPGIYPLVLQAVKFQLVDFRGFVKKV